MIYVYCNTNDLLIVVLISAIPQYFTGKVDTLMWTKPKGFSKFLQAVTQSRQVKLTDST